MGCPPIPVYCEKCGSKLEQQIEVTFDSCDGEKITKKLPYLRCHNSKCNCGTWFPDHLFECTCGSSALPSRSQWIHFGLYHVNHIDEAGGLFGFGEKTHKPKCEHCDDVEVHIIIGY
jgi:hypothetical protein